MKKNKAGASRTKKLKGGKALVSTKTLLNPQPLPPDRIRMF